VTSIPGLRRHRARRSDWSLSIASRSDPECASWLSPSSDPFEHPPEEFTEQHRGIAAEVRSHRLGQLLSTHSQDLSAVALPALNGDSNLLRSRPPPHATQIHQSASVTSTEAMTARSNEDHKAGSFSVPKPLTKIAFSPDSPHPCRARWPPSPGLAPVRQIATQKSYPGPSTASDNRWPSRTSLLTGKVAKSLPRLL
jgi:hypothetical protein